MTEHTPTLEDLRVELDEHLVGMSPEAAALLAKRIGVLEDKLDEALTVVRDLVAMADQRARAEDVV